MTVFYLPRLCPHCGSAVDGHTPAEPNVEQPPDADSWALCWECGKVFAFTENGTRRFTAYEEAEIKALPIYARMCKAMLLAIDPSELTTFMGVVGYEPPEDDDGV